MESKKPSPTIRGVNRPIPKGYTKHEGDPVEISDKIRPLTTKERSLIQTFPEECFLKSEMGLCYVCWEIVIPNNEDDKEDFRKKQFSNIAHKHVFEALTKAGFKRTGFDSYKLKDFKPVYQMYILKDFDSLIEYYSLYFKK